MRNYQNFPFSLFRFWMRILNKGLSSHGEDEAWRKRPRTQVGFVPTKDENAFRRGSDRRE